MFPARLLPTPSIFVPRGLCLQCFEQSVELLLIPIMIRLPPAEIWNVILANFPRRILASVGVKEFPVPECREACEPQRKKHPWILPQLSFSGLGDFGFDPLA